MRQQNLFDMGGDPPKKPPSSLADSEKSKDAGPFAAVEAIDPNDLSDRLVIVIDSFSLIYQVYHAMPDMSGPNGQPVGATHGFIRDVLDLLEKKKPDFLFCAFDTSEPTFRHDLYDQYKVNRSEMPEDLRPQITDIHRMLDAIGVARMSCPGFEADDVIATVARETEARGGRCLVVTSDKDCRQLITNLVQIYNIRKNTAMDAEGLQEQWGIRPDQVVDFQALVGDSVDDVPGVPLIGPKIAGELLNRFGTLEGVLDHTEEISGKKRKENLVKYRDQALMSRELVRLMNEVPVVIDWAKGQGGGVDRDQAFRLCSEFGLRGLADRVGMLVNQSRAETEWIADYHLVDTLPLLEQRLDQWRAADVLSVVTISSPESPRWAQLVGIAISRLEGEADYVPLGTAVEEPFRGAAIRAVASLLEDPNTLKIGHNLKRDWIVLRNHGIALAGIHDDTMVADYLLAPGERGHSISDLSRRYLNYRPTDLKDVMDPKCAITAEPPVSLVNWSGERADIPQRLLPQLRDRLAAEELNELFDSLEMPLTTVLAEMEFRGIRIDQECLRSIGKQLHDSIDELAGRIFELAGHEFNIQSGRQLGEVLFEELNLPHGKKTRLGQLSTDEDVLQQLVGLHEIPQLVLDFRHQSKLKSTYVDALLDLVHPKTGRIHTTFKQDVAATGRLSSQEPNLQNIPVRTEDGRAIRRAFVPQAGWQLLAADYSQIELRLLAHFSQDEALLRAFANDLDIHQIVASQVGGVRLDEVTATMRRQAKAVNFGIIYGQTPFGLAKSLGITRVEAESFIESYFARYPRVTGFMEEILGECRQNGYVNTVLGRRRTVEGVRDPSKIRDSQFRTLPERIAINTVIQGSAADLIKKSMIQIQHQLHSDQLNARMLLQVHDELVFEVPPQEVKQLATLVNREMSQAAQLDVPLKVDMMIGPNWADAESISP